MRGSSHTGTPAVFRRPRRHVCRETSNGQRRPSFVAASPRSWKYAARCLPSRLRIRSITGAATAADSILRRIQKVLDHVAARVEGRPRRKVAFVMGGIRPWVA